jgi:hypothetical protein
MSLSESCPEFQANAFAEKALARRLKEDAGFEKALVAARNT